MVQEVVDWTVAYVNFAYAELAPDGRPFGQEKLKPEDELHQYIYGSPMLPDGTQKSPPLRGNPQGWEQWMRDRVAKVQETMSGMPADIIAAAHPWDIVQRYAYKYSARMERLFAIHYGGEQWAQ